jgi:hypothetical protein
MDEGGELWKRAGCLVSAAEVPLPCEDDVELAVEGSGLAGILGTDRRLARWR